MDLITSKLRTFTMRDTNTTFYIDDKRVNKFVVSISNEEY